MPDSSSAEAGGSGAGATGVELLNTMDARVWSREFIKTMDEHQCDPHDEGWMIGWFANAIMVGFDTGQNRLRAALEAAQAERDNWQAAHADLSSKLGEAWAENTRLTRELDATRGTLADLWIAADSYLEDDSDHNWQELSTATETAGEVLGKPDPEALDAAPAAGATEKP